MELLWYSRSRISNSNAEKLFLVGDFNPPAFDWINQLPLSSDQLYVYSFKKFNDAFLTQVYPYATRNSNILDLVLTTVPDLVHSVSVSEGLLDSNHRSLNFFLNINNTSFHKRPKHVLNLKNVNLKELKETLQNLPWVTAMLDNDVSTNLINHDGQKWVFFLPHGSLETHRWLSNILNETKLGRNIVKESPHVLMVVLYFWLTAWRHKWRWNMELKFGINYLT